MAETSKKGITVDEKFLQEYLAKGGEAETPTGRKISSQNADEFLAEVAGEDVKSAKPTHKTPIKETPEERIERTRQEQEARKAERLDAQRRQQEASLAQQKQQAAKTLSGQAANAIDDHVVEPGRRIADYVSSLQTVGGVGLLLVVLFILLFTVVQVNKKGDTRLKMLWYMLNGRATLQGRVKPEAASQSTTSSEQAASNVATSFSQLASDIGSVVETAASSAITNTVTQTGNGIADFIGTIGNDFNQAFRNLP